MDYKKAILRKKGKRSWNQFSKDVGVSRETIRFIMSGRFMPRFRTLIKLGVAK